MKDAITPLMFCHHSGAKLKLVTKIMVGSLQDPSPPTVSDNFSDSLVPNVCIVVPCMITGQNVDKPKHRQPKRRQTKTSTNQNVNRPKRRKKQSVDRPKRRHLILVLCIVVYFFIIRGNYYVYIRIYIYIY